MRIETPPSPWPPPETAPGKSADSMGSPSFAALLGEPDAEPEPAERALGFLELGMFGAYAGVSPASLALGGDTSPDAVSEPAAADASAAPLPDRRAASGPLLDPATAPEPAGTRISAATLPVAKVDAPRPSVPASSIATAPASVPRGSTPVAVAGSAPVPEPNDPHGPAPHSASIFAATPAASSRSAEPAREEPGPAGAARRLPAPVPAARGAPLAATLVAQAAAVKLAVAAPLLAPGEGARLRQLAARLLAEHGLELGEMWINGGSEPASATQGEGDGSRTR